MAEKRSPVKVIIGGIIIILIAGGTYFYLQISKENAAKNEANERLKEAAAGVPIHVAQVMPSVGERKMIIPGEVKAFASVTVYAKISGYLKKITVDKGDDVREGQLLATLESPETDQNYFAAEADAKNKRNIATRTEGLHQKGVISDQEAQQATSDAAAAEASLAALAQLRSYETIKAPLSGKVTARYADPGSLVQSAANSQPGALPIVTISDVSKLRIYIYLDQKDALYIKEGDSVSIRLPEQPDINIPATITRYTGEIDSKTRTLMAEIDLDNRKNTMLPGSFVQVAVKIKARPFLQIPSDALVMKGSQAFVAVVDANGILHFKPIDVADNDGRIIQLAGGLQAGETVALGVGDALKEGDKVQVIKK
jgi:membrane fusion protein (multidrug efflux system)